MPQALSERPEELLRQYFTDTITPSDIHGYDPNQTNETATDFFPITNDWSDFGETYPKVVVTETEGPSIPNSGNTNYNGMQGDGSGPNQYNIKNITVSVQTKQVPGGGGYLDGTDYDELVFDIYTEIHSLIQNDATTAISEAQFLGLTPPTYTRENGDNDERQTWYQAQGTARMGVIDTP